jgi:hypothetical protein
MSYTRGGYARSVSVPPSPAPLFRRSRPLKRWRYVGAYSAELMLCAAKVRIGPFRQSWWAIATPDGNIRGRTRLTGGPIDLRDSHVDVQDGDVRIELELDEMPGRVVTNPNGRLWVWTRKQAGIGVRGHVEFDGRSVEIDAEGVVDDTLGYHQRHTSWHWSAGVGRGTNGERIGWNLVAGVNDPETGSERAVWIDGNESETAPVEFAGDLSAIRFGEGGELSFDGWATREDDTNLLVIRSSYRQPFGTFAGELPGGVRLAEGYGVMEWHDVRW